MVSKGITNTCRKARQKLLTINHEVTRSLELIENRELSVVNGELRPNVVDSGVVGKDTSHGPGFLALKFTIL